MTSRSALTVEEALRRAAVRATLAPSVRNIQPWRFEVGTSALEVHADPTRRRDDLDRTGRQSIISCGCALFNARVVLAADGWRTTIDRFPDPDRPDCLARISIRRDAGERVDTNGDSEQEIGHLDDVIETRRSSRRPFDGEPVRGDVVTRLISVAAQEGSRLIEVAAADDRRAVLKLAEVEAPCVLVLTTAADSSPAWLWAGEALEHVLLEITYRGYAGRPLTEVLESVDARARVRSQLGVSTYPQALVLVGHAPPTPISRRRRLVDVLTTLA